MHLPVFCFVSGTCGTSKVFSINKVFIYLSTIPVKIHVYILLRTQDTGGLYKPLPVE